MGIKRRAIFSQRSAEKTYSAYGIGATLFVSKCYNVEGLLMCLGCGQKFLIFVEQKLSTSMQALIGLLVI